MEVIFTLYVRACMEYYSARLFDEAVQFHHNQRRKRLTRLTIRRLRAKSFLDAEDCAFSKK